MLIGIACVVFDYAYTFGGILFQVGVVQPQKRQLEQNPKPEQRRSPWSKVRAITKVVGAVGAAAASNRPQPAKGGDAERNAEGGAARRNSTTDPQHPPGAAVPAASGKGLLFRRTKTRILEQIPRAPFPEPTTGSISSTCWLPTAPGAVAGSVDKFAAFSPVPPAQAHTSVLAAKKPSSATPVSKAAIMGKSSLSEMVNSTLNKVILKQAQGESKLYGGGTGRPGSGRGSSTHPGNTSAKTKFVSRAHMTSLSYQEAVALLGEMKNIPTARSSGGEDSTS